MGQSRRNNSPMRRDIRRAETQERNALWQDMSVSDRLAVVKSRRGQSKKERIRLVRMQAKEMS